MIIGCVAINKIPLDKVYIKYNILIPNKNTSMLIIFLLKIKYHLIYLLVKIFKILKIFMWHNDKFGCLEPSVCNYCNYLADFQGF